MDTSTLILIILAAGVCLYYFLSKTSYFKERGILHERPLPLFGNMGSVFMQRTAAAENIQRLYNLFSQAKYFGIYDFGMTPIILVRDPDLINTIAIKNFDNNCDHKNFVNESQEPIASKNLFGLRGDHWREMRKLLSPSFTSSKMKMMFELMVECAENMVTHVTNESGETGKTYDTKELLCRYSTDVVASCAFGISVNSFKDKNNEFFQIGKEMNFDSIISTKIFITRNFPKLSKYIRLKVFSSKIEGFFRNIVTETVKMRDEKGLYRPDMIQLMMETRNKNEGPTFDIDDMTAQAFVFFLAGFDSVSTVMSFLVHEVGVHPDVQKKLKEEIDDVLRRTNGKPTYEAINGMKYLDAVFNETIRLYPLVAYLDRVCVKEFELPPATPGAKPVKVKPGQSLWFSNYSLHRDPKYYPNPNKFDPDRFLNQKIDNSVYMPFGIGPRMCIGNRFAIMEAKIMMFYLLWRCELEPDVKTSIPIVMSKRAFVTTAENGFWIKIRAKKPTASVIHCLLSNGQEIETRE